MRNMLKYIPRRYPYVPNPLINMEANIAFQQSRALVIDQIYHGLPSPLLFATPSDTSDLMLISCAFHKYLDCFWSSSLFGRLQQPVSGTVRQ